MQSALLTTMKRVFFMFQIARTALTVTKVKKTNQQVVLLLLLPMLLLLLLLVVLRMRVAPVPL